MSESKQKIINDIYFDRAGFGSKSNTLKDAKEKDSSIKMSDVERFFKENVEIKRKPRGTNSFVAPSNNHTYQMDLFFMGQCGGLVMIDVLSKYAVVVPIDGRTPFAIIEATKEALKKMGKKSKIIYTDDERGIASQEFNDFIEDEGMELYRTRGHPAFAEKMIRTFKDMLLKRVEADEKKGKKNIQWNAYIFEIMITYNNKNAHSAINMTPNQARKRENECKAMISVALRAKKERKYPELNVGDKVKILRKKAITEKERSSNFLKGEYTVEKISKKLGQNYYTLQGFNRPLLRHELLKV